jgi:hypothetical protein
MGTLYLKKDDLEPKYIATLRNADGSAVDLTNATSVSLIVKQQGGAKNFKASGAFENRANGVVSYTWASGNTDTVGTFQMEWEVIWPTNRPETFPNTGYDTLIVGASLD